MKAVALGDHKLQERQFFENFSLYIVKVMNSCYNRHTCKKQPIGV